MKQRIAVYDTTLRDGRQGPGISYSQVDLLGIARRLDEFGVDYIEAGWPGSNPKDIEFFQQLSRVEFRNAKIAAFGSTRHAKNSVHDDPVLTQLVAARTEVVTIFGKSWELHVREVFRIPAEENFRMIRESVEYLKEKGKTVFFDAEHFFDGYRDNPEFALRALEAAAAGGADCLCLCETNGGMLPFDIETIVTAVRERFSLPLGIHCHNDSGCGVANSIAAVHAGCVQVQGTINGFGERTGNADLCSILPNLALKMGHRVLASQEALAGLTELSRYVSELANLPHNEALPYVGANAFAHKAGVHVNAVEKNSRTYEHVPPETVGNARRILISDYSGKSTVEAKAREFRVDFADKNIPAQVVARVKEMENQGFQFEGASASFELLLKQATGEFTPGFELKGFRVINQKMGAETSVNEATIKVVVGGREELAVAEGDGPVNALDNALRKVLVPFYPALEEMKLVDYKVRILEGKGGTGARTRVVMESSWNGEIFGTVGVSDNIIEASWQALVDSIEYLLMKHPAPSRGTVSG